MLGIVTMGPMRVMSVRGVAVRVVGMGSVIAPTEELSKELATFVAYAIWLQFV